MPSTVCITYDFDAVSTWLWSFDSWEMPTRHSRGIYGADIGAPRLLSLHDQYDIPATWFIPGHTIESFPEICREVHEKGYEIQHHGWSHTGNAEYGSETDERDDIIRGIDTIRDLTGMRPTGYRSPAWNFSEYTLDILNDLDFEWESSKMASDFHPHYVYQNWSAPRDGPYVRGDPTDIVELPVSWQRSDFSPLTFSWANPQRMGFFSEDSIFQRWYDQFDWMHENIEDGFFCLTLHPQVIGQAHRLMRLEEFVEYLLSMSGVEFRSMSDVATAFRERTSPER